MDELLDHVPTKDTTPLRWKYDTHLREYLLLLARKGEVGLESVSKFPRIIELSKTWHKTLNEIRLASLDGMERWVFVGFNEVRKDLIFPVVPAKGTHEDIPIESVNNKVDAVKARTDLVDLVGDIHSHPENIIVSDNVYLDEIYRFGGILGENIIESLGGSSAYFSPGDLYGLLKRGNSFSMMGLVQGRNNLFAFRTRESASVSMPSMLTQKSFSKYWIEQSGFEMVGDSVHHVSAVKPDASLWNMNLKIAERYKLVLYKGSQNQELHKVFPK